jgi:tRNA pseudouridine38/39 synthase
MFWDDGSLDIGAMRDAAGRLVGAHDFRNLCKMDVDAVCNFVRHIYTFTIDPEDGPGGQEQQLPATAAGAGRLWAFHVTGSAFLWHQVRCMAAVLLLIGRRLEAPSVMDALLDVTAMPGKPAYDMAPEEPLVLCACGYDIGDGSSQLLEEFGPTPPRTLALVEEHLRSQTRKYAVRAQIYAHALRAAQSSQPTQGGGRHVPLLQRKREATFEEQVARRPPGKLKWLQASTHKETQPI